MLHNQDFDNQDRIGYQLVLWPQRIAGHRDLGNVDSAIAIEPGNACLAKGGAGRLRSSQRSDNES
jgi:hypothetical protein